ncbi:DUF2972 domain-containing protein [Helicobacter trogontum]|uniref:DUF2972 domain-containing protein n=1 Tax=Helicobacter trogontum TaxID=50960 RepID=UPI00131A463F|nr:DUF2972 domain-containing protein [Helicobacter trogontum]
MNHIKKHIIWLESQEFKNEYGGVEYLVDIHTQTLGENTTTHNGVTTFPNHIGRFGADCHDLDSRFTDSLIDTYTYPFYPPLLEPANTDYSTIDSKIALELRLPPKMVGGGGSYKFVFVRYSLSGSLALQQFFERCDIYPCTYDDFLNNNANLYQNIYFDIQHFHAYETQEDNKRLYCVSPKDPVIILVRDPISRLKTLVNHGWYIKHTHNFDHNFTMQEDPYDVVNRKGYHNEHYVFTSNMPFVTNGLLEFFFSTWSFDYNSVVSKLSLHHNITYIDMHEIMPDNAFDTMTKLAKEFDFALPSMDDKEFYRTRRFGVTSYILPLTCIIHTHDGQTLSLHITSSRIMKGIALNINNFLFNDKHPLLDQVAFSMSREDLQALQEDRETLDKVKVYMVKFLDELKKRIDYIQRNNKHENDILEIFRGDRELCREFKTMLDRELSHIKAHRPDIVSSWKYYQEFERICVEDHRIG